MAFPMCRHPAGLGFFTAGLMLVKTYRLLTFFAAFFLLTIYAAYFYKNFDGFVGTLFSIRSEDAIFDSI